MNGKRRFFWTFTIGLLFASAACTLLLDRSSEQCSSDGDCARFGAGAVCRDSVCVRDPNAEGGGPGSEGGNDGNPNNPDAAFGHDGCIPGVPKTNEQFLNSCTPAQCIEFDNCDRLGICDGGLLGANPPDGAAPPTPPGPDSGATATCEATATSKGKKTVYVTGSSNFPPFLRAFAPVLAESGYAVVWQTTNSCTGVNVAYNVDPARRTIKEQAGRITEYYDVDGTAIPCTIVGEVAVDVGESDIYADTCKTIIGYDPATIPGGTVGEYLGPTMAMTFIVPAVSSQQAISAEAAQAVFGRGGVPNTQKLPYDNPEQFFNRASSTATNQIISRGIQVDPAKWWGVDKRTAGNMVTQMKQVPANLSEKTIGIISTDFADSERGNIKTLAFQAHGQGCAFWPDSSPFGYDKANVRDGHYPLWGPLHFFTRLTAGGPSTEAAGAFVLRFSVPRLDEKLVKGIIDSHNVPACAMRVTRDTEMGPIKPFSPPYNCDCYFEKVATSTTSCKSCTGPQDCTSDRPACNYGYCEPR